MYAWVNTILPTYSRKVTWPQSLKLEYAYFILLSPDIKFYGEVLCQDLKLLSVQTRPSHIS